MLMALATVTSTACGVAAGVCEDITTKTASLLLGHRDTDHDADPFAESKDEEELEANETVLEDC